MASHPRPETELKGNSKVGLTVLGKKRKQPLFVLQAAIKAETRLRKDIGAHGDVILTSSLSKKLVWVHLGRGLRRDHEEP